MSRLPNEMIAEIWGHILEPRDVESFALASKHIYAIGRPFVKEHNELKSEYSFFETGPNTRASAPAFLLKDVLLRPRVALYVTHLYMGWFQTRWDPDDNDDDDDTAYSKEGPELHSPYPDDDMALFIEAIRRASFVPRDKVEDWITRVEEGSEDPVLALLPLLLLNLTRITLVIQSDFLQHIDTFQRIAAAEDKVFLTRLKTVDLDIQFPYADGIMNWQCLRILSALPQVQSIHVKGMGSVENHELIDNHLNLPGSSNITELTFSSASRKYQRIEEIQLRGAK